MALSGVFLGPLTGVFLGPGEGERAAFLGPGEGERATFLGPGGGERADFRTGLFGDADLCADGIDTWSNSRPDTPQRVT